MIGAESKEIHVSAADRAAFGKYAADQRLCLAALLRSSNGFSRGTMLTFGSLTPSLIKPANRKDLIYLWHLSRKMPRASRTHRPSAVGSCTFTFRQKTRRRVQRQKPDLAPALTATMRRPTQRECTSCRGHCRCAYPSHIRLRRRRP